MITSKNLSFGYGRGSLLKEVTFSVKNGEMVALLGHNGSGKTTLLKLLNGLLSPTSGTVEIDGSDSSSNDARQKMGMVFQNPEDQLVYTTVEEDIAFGLENIGVSPPEMRRRVQSILRELGISSLSKREVSTLSFGQTQLVALAGVLALNPTTLLFDEPTTMLDWRNKSVFWRALKKIAPEHSILFSTNDLQDLKHATRVLLLHGGALLFDGTPSQLTRALLKRAELDG
ncbi:MAG: ATP-binding cassette domain-containing protein [Nanoarchaeota archaeon]|nr:ATP-binding cassette domain-containing protein [Nanoarchaeota archaeon]